MSSTTHRDNGRDRDDPHTQEPLLGGGGVEATIVKMSSPVSQPLDFVKPKVAVPSDDMCAEMMGNWGRWQLRIVSIIYLTKIPAAWFMACIIFTAPTPWYGEYMCDLDKHSENLHDNFSLVHPTKLTATGSLINNYCVVDEMRYNATLDNFQFQRRFDCKHFKYSIDPRTTLVTQFDLACSKNILVAITQCFHLFGVLVGGVVATYMMETISPRRVMMIGMILQIPFGLLTGYAGHFWLHVAFRWIVAGCAALIFTPCVVIMNDIVGGRYKSVVSANFEHSWSVAVILLSAIGYFSRTWTEIYIVISVPTVLLMILWIWLPDAPRWFLERGEVDKAKVILENAAKVNGRPGVKGIENFDEMLRAQAVQLINKRATEKKSNFFEMMKLKNGKRMFFLVMLTWSFIFTCYYGTLLNIRSFGRTNLIENTAIAGFAEVIGTLLGFSILYYLQNKWAFAGAFAALTGVINCTIWALDTNPDGSHRLEDLLVIGMLNRIGIACLLCVLTTCTAEFIPLPHKKRINFGATVFGRIIFITAPLIGFLVKYGDGVPLTFFGVMTFIAGIATLFLTQVQPQQQANENKIQSSQMTKF